MKITFFTIFTLLFTYFEIYSQNYSIDRPQFAISGEIIPVKTFAIESGTEVEFLRSGHYNFNYKDLTVRISMLKLMEMYFGFTVPATLIPKSPGSDEMVHNAGFASPKAGVKIIMKEKEEGVRMGLAFIGDASLNFGSKDFRDTKILPSFKIAMDIDWTDRTNMRVNYGIVWLENKAVIDTEGNPAIDPFVLVALGLNRRLNNKLSLFGEFFAQVKYNNFRSSYFAAGGLIIHVKENVQLDISGGAGLSPKSSRGFIKLGWGGLWPVKNLTPGN